LFLKNIAGKESDSDLSSVEADQAPEINDSSKKEEESKTNSSPAK